MFIRRQLTNMAPRSVITLATLFAIGLAVASTIAALSGPWLGISFDTSHDGTGLSVATVHPDSPNAGSVAPGDTIQSLQTTIHGRIELTPLAILEDPDQLESYEKYNAFFTYQQQIYDVLIMPSFGAILADGRHVSLTTGDFPSITVLPSSYWWLLFFGGISFIMGVSAWSMRRNETVTQILAVSGIGYMVGAFSCAIYIARELALPTGLFFGLASLNHLGIMTFAYAAVLTFWYYPKKLGHGHARLIGLFGVMALWGNETLQWLSWPAHAFYAHFIVAYSLLLLFSFLQWRRSRGAPLERTMLKWQLSTMVLSLGCTVLLFYAPVILTGKPIASTVLTFGAVFLFYLGLVIGNIRYHQFDMEYWWRMAWHGLTLILIVMIADMLFVYYLNMTKHSSLELSIGIAALYIALRQWLWWKFSGKNSQMLDRALHHLVETLLLKQQHQSPNTQWHQLISRVFNPLSLKTLTENCSTVTLERNGVAMRFPVPDGSAAIEAICCDQGRRLFTNADINLATRLLELMRHSIDINKAHEQGAQEERQRIQRDLHDDVAARLLSLIHQTREPKVSSFAHNALRGLRDVIHLLGAEDASLTEVMNDIESSAREQLSGSATRFEWLAPAQFPDVMLSSQKHINLRRIAREAVANALKHAFPQHIIFEVTLNSQQICMRICNDGIISDPSNWTANRGLNNIRSRLAEISGSHKWGIESREQNRQYCQLTICVPLPTNEQLDQHPAD